MKFSDIPQFTKTANYVVDVSWNYLEEQIEHYSQKDIGLELDPDFQRAHVWTEEKQIRYVEYILKGGKSSRDIYFNCKGWLYDYEGPIVLVDGKQRLEAVRKFLRNELPIFYGHYYEDFEDKPRSIITSFKFHINDLPTRKEVLQWYLDLNEGGVVHTEEELNKVKNILELEK